MDKLEKAMEKVRQQRAQHMGGAATAHKLSEHQPVASQSLFLTPEQDDTLEAHRVISYKTQNAQVDVFRLLRTQVLQSMAKGGYRTLAVTSPNYGDGKSTISSNLAISIAMDLKQTVLLVDLDLRKPCLHTYLGLQESYGLTDFLRGQASLPDCLQRLPFERLSVLPAGEITPNSSETLGSPQMSLLAQELKNRYADRLVIYDMPPILAQDDPLAFIPHIDAALLVVQDGVTRTDDIKRSLEILADTPVLGVILNNGVV